MELVDNARLTNTSFTCNQDHLTLTLACHLPAVPQRPHLIVTPDKPCQPTRRRALEPGAQRSQANNLVKLYCLAYALDLGWTQRPEVEIAFAQLPCRFSNCDRAGRCQCLHPRRESNGVSDRNVLAAAFSSLDRAHHHLTRVRTDPCLDSRLSRLS